MLLPSLLTACLAAFLLPSSTTAQTQEGAFPSNTSSWTLLSPASNVIVLGLSLTASGAHDPYIYNLTSAAYDAVNHSPTTQQSNGNQLTLVTPSAYNNLAQPNGTIAFISCDPSAYTGNIDLNTVLQSVVEQNVTAIVLYSSNTNFCNITNPPPFGYQNYYTMIATGDTAGVLSLVSSMSGGHTVAYITSEAGYTNILAAATASGGPSPSTAIAMIILYSITGVITLLFLVIIVTGAIRAHRHPERYGPRNIIGRTRQSRAKGIARAMLDTIPIVKFGEQDPAKPADIELGSESVVTTGAKAGTTRETANDAAPTSTEYAAQTESESSAGAAPTAAAEAATGETAREHAEDHEDEGLGCSICTEDFERGQDIRVLPCNHKFHPACVDPWLLDVSGTCPLCRVDLRPAEDREQEGETETGATDSTAAAAPANAENAPLPPPLDASAPSRRHTIRNFFDLRRLQGSTREERLSALRRFRQEQRSNNNNSSNRTDEEGATRVDESRLHRVRRTIFRN